MSFDNHKVPCHVAGSNASGVVWAVDDERRESTHGSASPDACLWQVFPWAQVPNAPMEMMRNEHKPGDMAVLVGSLRAGLRTFADAAEAGRA